MKYKSEQQGTPWYHGQTQVYFINRQASQPKVVASLSYLAIQIQTLTLHAGLDWYQTTTDILQIMDHLKLRGAHSPVNSVPLKNGCLGDSNNIVLLTKQIKRGRVLT